MEVPPDILFGVLVPDCIQQGSRSTCQLVFGWVDAVPDGGRSNCNTLSAKRSVRACFARISDVINFGCVYRDYECLYSILHHQHCEGVNHVNIKTNRLSY